MRLSAPRQGRDRPLLRHTVHAYAFYNLERLPLRKEGEITDDMVILTLIPVVTEQGLESTYSLRLSRHPGPPTAISGIKTG